MRFPATILSLAAAALLASNGLAFAKTIRLAGMFSPETKQAAAAPAGSVIPSGTVKGTLDTSTDMLRYTITYAGLTGPVEAAHFHGPATPGVEAGVLVPIPGPYHTGMSLQTKISAADAKVIEAGKAYINLHTKTYPDGEARAQINPEG